jgi:hypothetical protein
LSGVFTQTHTAMAEALVSVVEHAASVSDLSFARFKAFWAEQNLKTIHLLRRPLDEPEECFLGAVFGYLVSACANRRTDLHAAPDFSDLICSKAIENLTRRGAVRDEQSVGSRVVHFLTLHGVFNATGSRQCRDAHRNSAGCARARNERHIAAICGPLLISRFPCNLVLVLFSQNCGSLWPTFIAYVIVFCAVSSRSDSHSHHSSCVADST